MAALALWLSLAAWGADMPSLGVPPAPAPLPHFALWEEDEAEWERRMHRRWRRTRATFWLGSAAGIAGAGLLAGGVGLALADPHDDALGRQVALTGLWVLGGGGILVNASAMRARRISDELGGTVSGIWGAFGWTLLPFSFAVGFAPSYACAGAQMKLARRHYLEHHDPRAPKLDVRLGVGADGLTLAAAW